MNNVGHKEWYSVKEFAEKFGVCEVTIRRAIHAGKIHAIRVGMGKKSPYRIASVQIDRLFLLEYGEGDINEER